jgi:hypothetical protein
MALERFRLRRYLLSIPVAIAPLAGCGGSQPPIGAPGSMPKDVATWQADG